jgi:hypothetical protein
VTRPEWCGKVLVAGGEPAFGAPLKTAELYDPKSGRWSPAASLDFARSSHTATLLANGKVLVTGGRGANASAELYDPGLDTWSSCPTATSASGNCPGPMNASRYDHTATLLADGRVLVAGGPQLFRNTDDPPTAELYDPATGTWTPTGQLNQGRYQHTATRLTDGNVLVTGGTCPIGFCRGGPEPSGETKVSSELYHPATGTWTSCPGVVGLPDCPGWLLRDRAAHSATLLLDGQVLAVGGADNNETRNSAELYDPFTFSWTPTSTLTDNRYGHGAALLPDGRVLVAGGRGPDFQNFLASAELYDPATADPLGGWESAGSMSTVRGSEFTAPHSVQAVLLSSDPEAFAADSAVCGKNCGKVLVVGGFSSAETGLASAELYTPPPEITAIAPKMGPAAGGTAVVVEGRGFTHRVTEVRFGEGGTELHGGLLLEDHRAHAPRHGGGKRAGDGGQRGRHGPIL